MRPSIYGYVDQQTGGYIGANVTYPAFEAAREHWYLMPGAIQINAAHNIHFRGGTYTQLGAGGFGIGTDDNACITGVGLGAKNISVREGYFTQVMGNSITAGGIQIPAHHPNDSRMINSGIHIEENIFYNISSLFSSTVPIFFSYVQDSSIMNNDISHAPYSGICHGYGWGMNDAGGSQTYIDRGTYQYQPLFHTPTTAENNLIKGNLINDYGWSHTDLGGLYTLSKSPSTQLVENCVYDSQWYGLYTDEGSNSLIIQDNTFLSLGNLGSTWGWYNPNQGIPIQPGMHTANNTLIGNTGVWAPGRDFTNAPDGTGVLNNTFLRNFVIHELADMTAASKRVAYRAGIPPAKRNQRPVSNTPSFEDVHAALHFPTDKKGTFRVSLQNFDDGELTGVSFQATASHSAVLKPIHVPATVPGDSESTASWHLSIQGCQAPQVSVQVTYTNARTQITKSILLNGTMPGLLPLDAKWTPSSTWPASYGQLCDTVGIRSGGRNVNGTYDDWAVLAHEAVIGSNGSVTARVVSLDRTDPWSKAGVVVRDSFQTKSPSDDASHVNSTGYAALMVTPDHGLMMLWSPSDFDSPGDGFLSSNMTVSEVTTPIYLRLNISTTHATGFYSADGHSWTKVGDSVILPRHTAGSKAGLIVNSHTGYRDGTALFDSVAIDS
ncbi:hypothetical protein N7474_009518 [Penicillium riverlandense]|uniref:uncharacterized protein n=1 Tax=Penicillium riverlandense TaxID=1903569 RepID=UPI002549AD65|nr:uncharacterized protein N7474_009518 [Penicillium riverlandense]KAJ5808249.1 hypothetical protein N7474_009518 [Penicillium riverlandense]